MSRCLHRGIALLAVAVGISACGGGQQEASPPAAAAPAPLPGESTVSGRIKFEGTAPKMQLVRMDADPLCMVEGATSEVLIVGPDNGLQNAFVYVKDGLDNRTFAPPQTPVVLDQKGCRYLPHVFGVQVGQPMEILNSDPTLHNVHALPKTNSEFNFGQQAGVPKATKTFDKPEIMVRFRCDVHGWMTAYAGVVPHPFFAVSSRDGGFEIKGLPAGTYTIEAWHERLGTQTQQVTVDGKTGAAVDFAFKAQT